MTESAKTAPYVIHVHNAFKAGKHYDYRMKYLDKKLLISFAIPKEKFPVNVGDKSIAIQTNDHNVGWLFREKLSIPKGEYGGGFIERKQYGKAKIIVWKDDFIGFVIEGDFVSGTFYLIKTDKKRTSRKDNSIWILYHKS
jgi:hypothetical protein